MIARETNENLAGASLPKKRVCGDCSLCCYLFSVEEHELTKPVHTWCPHCRPGRGGCAIYAERPRVCAEFRCDWLAVVECCPDFMYPLKSKIVIRSLRSVVNGRPVVEFNVHPKYPNRWRQEPYYSFIKHCSASASESRKPFSVRVVVGDAIFFISPTREIQRSNSKLISAEELEAIEGCRN
jgi:hypothetical protein